MQFKRFVTSRWTLAALAAAILALSMATPGQVSSTHAATSTPGESLGTVAFAVSCSTDVQRGFNRGVALLHDFWYDEAKRQFQQIARLDPGCAMAHWGVVLSTYHQIWDRPDDQALKQGWKELQQAAAPAATTARERAYILALMSFFKPGQDYPARVAAYSAVMAELYRRYPADVDAGAFYALSLLAAHKPNDTSLTAAHAALAVLSPLFAKYPDHPGVVHYIIHACDTPSLASQGLAAARHYGEIAPSGAHAVHMPAHIFARLGMWPEDIRANLASVAASHSAETRQQSDWNAMDEFHSDDFLLYAYLQSGEESKARAILDDTAILMDRYEAMPHMSPAMHGHLLYQRNKFPAFYYLETRDWKSAAALEPVAGGGPEDALVTYWARVVADGHLHRPAAAQADFERRESLMEEVADGPDAYIAQSPSAQISRSEMRAWVAFAEGHETEALKYMREAADLQDKIGQGEVDIPAREMLGDVLLESGHSQAALVEYEQALKLSPKRFNGLFAAGMAAEVAGDHHKAADFYAALLTSTDQGSHSVRPELAHARNFLSPVHVAAK